MTPNNSGFDSGSRSGLTSEAPPENSAFTAPPERGRKAEYGGLSGSGVPVSGFRIEDSRGAQVGQGAPIPPPSPAREPRSIASLMAAADASPHIDRSEHVDALGEWCDCSACVSRRDRERETIAEAAVLAAHRRNREQLRTYASTDGPDEHGVYGHRDPAWLQPERKPLRLLPWQSEAAFWGWLVIGAAVAWWVSR